MYKAFYVHAHSYVEWKKCFPHPEHANALRQAGLAPPNLPTMGDLWSKQDKKVDIEKEPDVNVARNYIFSLIWRC